MNKEDFEKELLKLGIALDEEKIRKLDRFYHLLIEWNEKINLTTITDVNDVYLKHFYDSLTLIKEVDLTKNISLCDVGSGAGFPGIVLKIIFPNLNIILIDSLQKRVNYLNEVIKFLNLENIKAEHFRMEDYSRLHNEEFDIITARAVANLGVISEISIRALKVGGNMVFMKANCDEEISMIKNKLDKLGLEIQNINKFKLPFENSNRTLINLKKVKKTNSVFPRKIQDIKKEYIFN